MTDGLALLTDLYQLTMASGYWKSGQADREAVFHLTFRRAPFGGGYAIAGGIAPAIYFGSRRSSEVGNRRRPTLLVRKEMMERLR